MTTTETPVAELVDGMAYRVVARNFFAAVWSERARGFIGIREKFGDEYLFVEYPYADGAPYGTTHAFEALGQVPDGVELECYGPRDDRGYLTNNQPLFDWLQPLRLAEDERWRQENERKSAEAAAHPLTTAARSARSKIGANRRLGRLRPGRRSFWPHGKVKHLRDEMRRLEKLAIAEVETKKQ
jgi:hypothetical protein